MKLDSRKKSRRDRIMRSKSFETQEMREIGREETGKSRGFPILWMGIIEDVFQMEEKKCKDQKRLKMCWRKSNLCWSKELATLSGSLAVHKERFCGSCEKFNRGEREAERRVRLFRAHGLAKLAQVACGSAMQEFWLGG